MTSAGRGRGRATIVDVARAAEVSRQTVSNVVNNPQRVAPETLERVHREIERLGFRPSLAARSLKQERANALGIELNSLGVRRLGSILDSFFVELTVASRHRDAHLVPFAAAEHDRPIPAYQDLVASNLVDAFILTDTRRDDPRPPWLRDHGPPVRRVRPHLGRPVVHLVGGRGRPRRRDHGGPPPARGRLRPGGVPRLAGGVARGRRAAGGMAGPRAGGRRRRTPDWQASAPAGRRPRRRSRGPRDRRDRTRWCGRLRLGHARDGRLDGPARARAGAGA